MNNYEQLLNELLFGAKELIDKAKNVNDKFDMSIKLAEQVRLAIQLKPIANEVANVEVVPVAEPVVQVEQIPYKSKEEYEAILGYSISNAAYDEYKDIQKKLASGIDVKIWIPDPDENPTAPTGFIVPLAIQENPIYNKQEELVELGVEDVDGELVEELPIPTDVTPEVAGQEVVEAAEMTVEEAVEKALAEDSGVEIDIDTDPVEEVSEVVVEIDGELLDIIDQYNLIKTFNNNLEHDELVERATDWIEFGINKETYDLLSFIANKDAEMIQCKTYLAYYMDAMGVDSIVYYINYFASNIEEDEEGNEVYVNDELQLDFLNEDNISAFLEYVQQNQQ